MSIQRFGNANLGEIKKMQADYSINLPGDYIDFLMDYNGGIVEKDNKNKIFVEDLSSYITIDVFYGLNTGSRTSEIRTWTDKFDDELIERSIIIGDDVMQGFIVMICEGEFAAIYYWDDAYQFEQSTDEENTYWITDDFSSFIKQIL